MSVCAMIANEASRRYNAETERKKEMNRNDKKMSMNNGDWSIGRSQSAR